jgi:hypothetical protein
MPVISNLSPDFTKFLQQWQDYCRKSSALDYSPLRFQWYRTTKEELNYTKAEELAEPYEMENLLQDSDRYIDEAFEGIVDVDEQPRASRGDAAILATQNDLLISAIRSFNERHSSKLRHFSHAEGILDRLGDPDGIIQHGIFDQLMAILENSKHPRNRP